LRAISMPSVVSVQKKASRREIVAASGVLGK
jgi:hypothetical protein